MNVLSERGRERVDRICRLRDEGLSFSQIAEEIGTTRCAVAGVLSRHKRGQKKLSREEEVQIVPVKRWKLPVKRWKPGGVLLRAGWFG
jgi:hypothetical protein